MRRRTQIAAGSAVVALVALVASVVHLLSMGSGTEELQLRPFSFPPLRLDPYTVLRRECVDELSAATLRWGPAEKRLFDVFKRYNRYEASRPADGTAKLLEQASASLALEVSRYMRSRGREQFDTMGRAVCSRFVAALAALLGKVQASNQNLLDFVANHATSREVQDVIDLGGGFLVKAAASGLVHPRGSFPTTSRFVSRVMCKYRWLYLGVDQMPPRSRLTRFELMAYLRWKIELNRKASVRTRLKAIDDLVVLDRSFPAERARGIVYAQADDLDRAAQHLWRAFAQDPSDLLTIRYLDILTRGE